MTQLIDVVAAYLGRGEYSQIRKLMHVLDDLLMACEAKCRELEHPKRRRVYDAADFIERARSSELEPYCPRCKGNAGSHVRGVGWVECDMCEGHGTLRGGLR